MSGSFTLAGTNTTAAYRLAVPVGICRITSAEGGAQKLSPWRNASSAARTAGMYGQARSVLGPAPPASIVIVTIADRSETGVAVILSPPSAPPSPPWQVADSGPRRYETWPGLNQVPKIRAFGGGARDVGRLSVAGASCGEYRAPA